MRPANSTADMPATCEAQVTIHIRRIWQAWLDGSSQELATILGEQPELLERPEVLTDLVYSEYWLRKQVDESVSEAEYLTRFPQIAEALQKQFEMRREMDRFVVASSTQPESVHTVTSRQPLESRSNVLSENISQAVSLPEGYEPVDILGIGGMGVVVKALQTALNREVAIKSLKAGEYGTPRDQARLRQEAQVLAQLKHPNVIQIFDVVEERGRLFLIMECADGLSLARECNSQPIAAKAAVQVTLQITQAIAAAHAAGFLHRDIKPSNVLRDAAGTIKVGDFGLARRCMNDRALSLTGEVLGTPAYMSPEQISGPADSVDVRSDIYGIGATLYQLITGRPPFTAASTIEVMHQILHDEPVAPRRLDATIPRDLESICLQCLHKSPSRRYQTACELRDDLVRFQSGQATRARPITRLERTHRWLVRNPWLSLTSTIGALSLLILLTVSTWYFARIGSLEAINQAREGELTEARKREQLSAYYALAASIQSRTTEKKLGWTWANLRDIQAALQDVPNESEKFRLRQFLIQSLDSFDVGQSEVVLEKVDPFGMAWNPSGTHMALGENMAMRQADGEWKIVVHLLGPAPQRRPKLLLLELPDLPATSTGPEGIRSLLFMNDKELIVGCRSGWVLIADIETGVVLRKFKAHGNFCFGLALDTKRNCLITASSDASVAVWDLQNFGEIARVQTDGAVRDLAIVEDCLFANAGSVMCVRFPSLKPREPPAWIRPNPTLLKTVPGTSSILVASSHQILIAEADAKENEFVVPMLRSDRAASFHHADFAPDARWCSISGVDAVRFFDLLHYEAPYRLLIPGQGAKYSSFDPHLSQLWITNNKQLYRFQLRLPAEIHKTIISPRQIVNMDDGRMELTPTFHGTSELVSAWSEYTDHEPGKRLICMFNVPDDACGISQAYGEALQGLRDSSQIVWFSPGIINRWDCTRHEMLPCPIELSTLQVNICLSHDGTKLWIGDTVQVEGFDRSVGRVRALRFEDGAELMAFVNTNGARTWRISGVEDIACGRQRTAVLLGNGVLQIYNLENAELRYEIDLDKRAIPKFVSLTVDETAAIVSMEDGRLLRVVLETKEITEVHKSETVVTAMAQTSQFLATGNSVGEVDLWSLESTMPKYLFRLTKENQKINEMQFTGDNKRLAIQAEGQPGCHMIDLELLRAKLVEAGLGF